MAVTGVFAADFASFYDACQKAEVHLKSFETGAGKVESALNRMVDNFSGRKTIQDATLMAEAVERVGGVSRLTERELARVVAQANEAAIKLKAMGQEVPAELQKIIDGAKGIEQAFTDAAKSAVSAQQEILDKVGELGGRMKDLGTDGPAGLRKITDETKQADTAQVSLGGTVRSVAGFFAGMVTARAAFNFVSQTVEEASALSDLSKQVRINVEELQLLKVAAKETGIEANELANALFTLSQRAAGGDAGVAHAMHLMGMSLKDIEGLEGEGLFLRINSGLGALQGSLRDTAAAELYGSKLGRAMAGASTDIEAALAKARELNNYLSKETVDQLDTFGKSIDRVKQNVSNFVTLKVVGPLAEDINALSEAAARGASTWELLTMQLPSTKQKADEASASMQALAQSTDDATSAADRARAARDQERQAEVQAQRFIRSLRVDADKEITESQARNLAQLKEINALNAQNAAAVGVNAAQYAKYVQEQQNGEQAAKQLAAATEELESAGMGWQGTLASIQPYMAESIRQYLEAGVSQSSLATVYGLTATQIKAVASALQEEQEIQKLTTKSVQETTALWQRYYSMREAQGGTALQVQLAQIDAWFNTEVSKLKESDKNYQQHYAGLVAVAAASREALKTDWASIGSASRQALEETAQAAEVKFRYVVERADQFAPAVIANFEKTAIAARAAADQWGAAFTENLTQIDQAVVNTTQRAQQALTFSQALDAVRRGEGTLTGTIQAGGPFTASRPEIMKAAEAGRYYGPVDQSGRPDFSQLSPRADGRQGMTVVNNINATGSWDMPSQAADIARRIEDEVVKRLAAMGGLK